MSPERLLECSFFIPLHRDKETSDGEAHLGGTWETFSEQLYAQFLGRTLAPGLYEGLWKSPKPGQPIHDESRRYIVAVPESQLDSLRRLLVEACGSFKQQMIYLSIAGQVELIEAPSDGGTP